jgi:hypothetical protein
MTERPVTPNADVVAPAAPIARVPWPKRPAVRVTLAIATAGLYWISCVAHPRRLDSPRGDPFDILAVQDQVDYSNTAGKRRFLSVAVLRPDRGTQSVGERANMLLPWASSLATARGDTLLVIQDVRFPYSRFLPWREWRETWFRHISGSWQLIAHRE